MPAPYIMQTENLYSSFYQPNKIHAVDNATYQFWFRYLFKRAISVFKFTIPETWEKNYFEYVLFGLGFGAVVETDAFGVIFQQCGLQGLNVYYQPTKAIISNRLLKGILNPTIGLQTEIIKLQPDYTSVVDIVSYYANKIALAAEALDMNLINSKLSYVFMCHDSTTATSMKKLYDEIAKGNPAVFADKKLFDDEGKPKWATFTQDLKSNYIAGELLADTRTVINDFDSLIGIPNANTTKRERMLTDEINANNVETETLSELWLETLTECFEKVNSMFGLSLSVERRFEQNDSDNDNSRSVQLRSDDV